MKVFKSLIILFGSNTATNSTNDGEERHFQGKNRPDGWYGDCAGRSFSTAPFVTLPHNRERCGYNKETDFSINLILFHEKT
jgi:hypothetical protein